MLEGLLRGRAGLFPANCVQEVKLRNPDAIRQQQVRKKQTVPQMHANLNFYFFSGCHLRGAPPRGGGLRPQPRPRPPRRPRRRRRFRLLDAHHAAGQEREGDLRGGNEVKGQTVSFLTLFFATFLRQFAAAEVENESQVSISLAAFLPLLRLRLMVVFRVAPE